MKIELTFNYNLELHDCKLDNLVFAFKQMIPAFLSAFIAAVLRQFADRLLGNMAVSRPSGEEQPFNCSRCGAQTLIWKTRASRTVTTKLTTCMGSATVPQMQVQCKKCGHKEYIVRRLLGMPAYSRMSECTEHQLALCGSLTSFRVGEVFSRVYGAFHSRSTIWRCLQKVGKLMSFSVSPNELGEGQADGTGIPIRGVAKRGKELKVMIQKNTPATAKMTGSRWRLAGLDLGSYNGSWERLLRPSLEAIKSFKSFFLTTDGDEGIRKGLGNLIIHLQRCLWHIPHQLKHCLWADGVARTSGLWKAIMARAHQLVAVRHLLDDDEIEPLIEMKNGELGDLVNYCRTNGCEKSASYLENAKPDMFTSLKNRLEGRATSQVERVMRTVNLRINYGKWSISGALNAMKVRLAFYYNGYDPSRYKPSASGSASGEGNGEADGKKT
jgi:ribosomal protein L37E